MKRTRLASNSTGKRSAPILYYMPERALPGAWARERASYAQQAFLPHEGPDGFSEHVALVATGQIFHLFVHKRYVDSFLSPDISNLFEKQIREPHVTAAVAEIREAP